MPVEGWKNLTVSDEVYSALEKEATRQHRKVANLAEKILMDGLGIKEALAK